MGLFNPFSWKHRPTDKERLDALKREIEIAQSREQATFRSSRRSASLVTLPSLLVYLIYFAFCLVAGYSSWTTPELLSLALGPVLIYSMRKMVLLSYEWRLSWILDRLGKLRTERDEVLQSLKDDLRYQEISKLINEYDPAYEHRLPSPPPPPPPQNMAAGLGENGTEYSQTSSQLPQRTADGESWDMYEQAQQQQLLLQQNQPYERHWYDRIFNVLLGDDENHPANRDVLICRSCHLVNGRLPAGMSIAQLGHWTCMGCQYQNVLGTKAWASKKKAGDVTEPVEAAEGVSGDEKEQQDDGGKEVDS